MTISVVRSKVMRISKQPFPVQAMIDKKQLDNVEYSSWLDRLITSDERCTHEVKSRIAMAKGEFSKKKIHSTSKLDLQLRKKLVKCCLWSVAFYGTETLTLQKIVQKCLGSFEM
jgi:hypothetical protein